MKRKQAAEPVIAPEILDAARRTVNSESAAPPKPCVVCGAPRTPPSNAAGGNAGNTSDNLCWVCRRLKLSAWRETEQVTAQE